MYTNATSHQQPYSTARCKARQTVVASKKKFLPKKKDYSKEYGWTTNRRTAVLPFPPLLLSPLLFDCSPMSFLNELRGQRKDAVAVLSRLYAPKGGRNGLGGTSTTNDILSLTELLVSTLSTKEEIDRDVSCRTLTEIVTSLPRFREVEGRISTIIDRLPALFESYGGSQNDGGKMDAILGLLESLLAADSEELLKKINKIVPKLTACAIRLSEKEVSAPLGLAVLQVLLESRSRTLMIPSSTAIKKACLACWHHTVATETLALLFAIEPPEAWQRHWAAGVLTCVRLVQLLGLHMHGSRDNRGYGSDIVLWIAPETTMNKLHGYRRALAVERAVGHCCGVLIQMLRNGCATGPIAIDLAALCPVLAYMLALSIDVDDGDVRNGVENEQGVAPLHLKIVLPQLKVHPFPLAIIILDDTIISLSTSLPQSSLGVLCSLPSSHTLSHSPSITFVCCCCCCCCCCFRYIY